MALGFNHLTDKTEAAQNNSLTSDSFTPTADAILVVAAFGSFSDAPAEWDIDDSETLTWTSKESTGNINSPDGNDSSGNLWTASVGASPASMTVTVDWHGTTGSTVAEFGFAVFEITDGDISDPFAQIDSTVVGSDGPPSSLAMATATLGSTPTEKVGAIFLPSVTGSPSWNAPPTDWDRVTGADNTSLYISSDMLESEPGEFPTSVTHTVNASAVYPHCTFIFELNNPGSAEFAAELADSLSTSVTGTGPPPVGILARSPGDGRFVEYLENLRTPLIPRFQLVSVDGQVLASSIESETGGKVAFWGPETSPVLRFDRGSKSVRSLTMTTLGGSGFSPGLLDPDVGNLLFVSIGPEGVAYWPIATLVVDQVDISVVDGVLQHDLSFLDRARPVDSTLASVFTFDAGETVEAVVADLLGLVLDPDDFDVAATGYTVPDGALSVGDNIGEAVADLLEGCGHELTADVYGRVVSRPIPPSNVDAATANRWSYGPDGLAFDGLVRKLRRSAPQGYVIEGGGGESGDPTITRTVVDTDPSSRGRFSISARQAVELPKKRYSWIRSEAQADAAGYGQLRRNGDGPGVVTFMTAPNPAMRSFDVVDLVSPDDPEADGTYQVLGMQLPTEMGQGSRMAVTARRAWQPDLFADSEPAPLTAGFQASFTDDFDRADEDLEGTDWTEIKPSWGLVNRLAIMRYPHGSSLALVRQPLQHANHYATTRIAKIPSGKNVGPFVRCDGTYSGYVALADPEGRVSLESWINGSVDDRLASYSTGLDLVGRELRLSALGSVITVAVDGEDIGSVTDDRHSGRTMVGMSALGGSTSNAPSVSYFEAGQAT